MTPAYLRRCVKTWQKRLALDHFALEIELDEPPEEADSLASMSISDQYDIAYIRFRGDWPEHDVEMLNRLVVHELLHIVFRDIDSSVHSLLCSGFMGRDAQHLWADRFNHAEEGAIDRLAWRFVELAGVVE